MREQAVSVIIVNWNTCGMLRDCLASLYRDSGNVPLEVIVVDNHSADHSAAMVKSEYPQVRLIANNENIGFAAGCNQGLRIAKGRYSLLLNSDTIIKDAALEKSLRYADENQDVGVLGCRVFWPDGRHQYTCFRFPNLYMISLGSLLFFRTFRDFGIPALYPERYVGSDFSREMDVDVVAGCFFLVRREVIERVGIMDDAFFMYGEEMEWCWRIKNAGWKIRYFPDASIIHIYGGSALQIEDQTKVNKRKGQLLFLDKTRGWFYAWLANMIMTAGVVIRIPFWFLRGLIKAVKRKRPGEIFGYWLNVACFHFAGLVWPVWR